MKSSVFRVGLLGLALLGAGAAVSSAIAYACTSSGCSGGCKLSAKWCNTSLDTGWDFGASKVVIGGSCALSPDGGFANGFTLRSYDAYESCTSECSADILSPGAMSGTRESTGQGLYFTQCVTAP